MTTNTAVSKVECATAHDLFNVDDKETIRDALRHVVSNHPRVLSNPDRITSIREVIRRREAILGKQGYLYTVTPKESSGRSPGDTYLVRDDTTAKTIDWNSPCNHPLDRATFYQLWSEALGHLKKREKLYVSDRVIGADYSYALPVTIVTDSALTCLFTLNMFRPVPCNIRQSCLAGKPFLLLVLPYQKVAAENYHKQLRQLSDGRTSDMVIAMDCENRMGLVMGSEYGGSVKKLMFTVMNYYLPFINVLPLHCSANENIDGEPALFLGLSGTGKTSLSADPKRALLGDDEHGWSRRGIANFENGCYAKLINLNPQKEPEIFRAVFHRDHCLRHGAIVENTMIYPDGRFDLADDRLTPNSRASYPLCFLRNFKETARGYHPKTIIFLTADANGVLPPIARLNRCQTMLWFLMGYTSKLAGTETGVVDPVSVFSRFFAEPFMPLLPNYYIKLLGDMLDYHPVSAFLLNTGWSGGPYGIGQRMDINLTKHLLNAALSGALDTESTIEDPFFHLLIPKRCPGLDRSILFPRNSWSNQKDFETRAQRLAIDFTQHFDQAYGQSNIPADVACQCPGK